MSSAARIDHLDWRELVIPDGDPPVLVYRLFVDQATGGATTLVRFPPGWRRPGTGYYVIDEEALFLEGSFRMTGLEYPGVTYSYFPAGYGREESISEDGALAIASFGGRADWRRGVTTTDASAMVRKADWRTMPLTACVELGHRQGRMLRSHPAGSTWMFDEAPAGKVPAGRAIELFSLADYVWARVAAGDEMPSLRGPVYCRIRSSGG